MVWTALLNGPIYGGVYVKNTTVAVATMAGSFYMLDAGTGDKIK